MTAPTLERAIRIVEDRHFRTTEDSGGNLHAQLILNAFRNVAGLPSIHGEDLPAWDGMDYTMPPGSKLLRAALTPTTPKEAANGS